MLPAHQPQEPFDVRHAWVTMALQVVSQGASAFVLYGGDIVLETSWPELLADVWDSFDSIADEQLSPPPTANTRPPVGCSDAADGAPQKLWGCVVLRDRQAPGWPCFPVIGKRTWRHFRKFCRRSSSTRRSTPSCSSCTGDWD